MYIYVASDIKNKKTCAFHALGFMGFEKERERSGKRENKGKLPKRFC